MPRKSSKVRQYPIKRGGKVNIANSFKKLGSDIKSGFNKTIANPIENKVINPASTALSQAGRETQQAFNTAGTALGQFTNNQLLPGVVSVGIPLVSDAVGVAGAEFGIPPQISSSLTENLLKNYIPDKYQSDNKYLGLLSDAIGTYGSENPMDYANLATKALGTMTGSGRGRRKIKNLIGVPTPDMIDSPNQDLINQTIMNAIKPRDLPPDIPDYSNPPSTNYEFNSDSTPYLYSSATIDPNDIRIMTSPYSQKAGSPEALEGAGIRKRRGRPRKKIIQQVEIIERLPHERFSNAKNTSLDQYLRSLKHKEDQMALREMREGIRLQNKFLKEMMV